MVHLYLSPVSMDFRNFSYLLQIVEDVHEQSHDVTFCWSTVQHLGMRTQHACTLQDASSWPVLFTVLMDNSSAIDNIKL